MSSPSRTVTWLGIILILIAGLIHFIEAPDAFEDITYKGVLFILNGLGAAVAAIGIYRGARSWGWSLGLIITALTVIGYVASRTVGLPGLPAEPEEWLEPLGVVSVLAEAVFAGIALKVLSGSDHRFTLPDK